MKTNSTSSNGSESGVLEMSIEEQQELLTKLLGEKNKQKERSKQYRENNKEKCDEWSKRSRVRNTIIIKKAKEVGIEVSEEEVNEYILLNNL